MKMIRSIFLFFLLILLGLSTAGCGRKNAGVKFELETFPISKSGWGYKIYKQDKSFIVQYNIPAIPEKKTFRSREDAVKVGSLMVRKLEKNQMPSVTVVELDSLKIIYD